MERKNPLGLVEAFKRAFAPGEGPLLYIKSINGDRMPEQLRELEAVAHAHPDIRVADGFVPAEHVRALTALSDCYVSLHRSEGFGLTIAEAMAYGKPAIATRYSGNLTFMEPDNSYLVGYTTSTVPEGCPPYPVGAMWADPDLDEAARHMRTVFEDPEEAQERGRRGQQTIRERHSIERTAAFLAERLPAVEQLRHERARDEARTPAQGAKEFLARGPSLPWDVPSPRFGRLGVFARRVLLRLLRPYLVRQREWETLVADALLEAEVMNRQHRERIEKLEALLEEAVDVRRRGYRTGGRLSTRRKRTPSVRVSGFPGLACAGTTVGATEKLMSHSPREARSGTLKLTGFLVGVNVFFATSVPATDDAATVWGSGKRPGSLSSVTRTEPPEQLYRVYVTEAPDQLSG
jgi:hypothetical protein